jgi:hypothetical protein
MRPDAARPPSPHRHAHAAFRLNDFNRLCDLNARWLSRNSNFRRIAVAGNSIVPGDIIHRDFKKRKQQPKGVAIR